MFINDDTSGHLVIWFFYHINSVQMFLTSFTSIKCDITYFHILDLHYCIIKTK